MHLVVLRAGRCERGGSISHCDPSQKALGSGHHQMDFPVFLVNGDVGRLQRRRDQTLSWRVGLKLQQAWVGKVE